MSKKNLAHGEGNRVAPGQKVFDPNDSSHASKSSPISLKRKELAAKLGDETYRTAIAPDIKESRQKETTRKRLSSSKGVKPI